MPCFFTFWFLPLKNKPHPQRAQTHTLSLDLKKGWSLQLYLPSLCHIYNLAKNSQEKEKHAHKNLQENFIIVQKTANNLFTSIHTATIQYCVQQNDRLDHKRTSKIIGVKKTGPKKPQHSVYESMCVKMPRKGNFTKTESRLIAAGSGNQD